MSEIGEPSMSGGFEFPGIGGGRRRSSRKGRGKGRGRKGGSFLAEITVPAALLAATQYMKGPSSYRRTKRRGSGRRKRSSQRRRRR
jgi:Mg-chelatase subunit ChlD